MQTSGTVQEAIGLTQRLFDYGLEIAPRAIIVVLVVVLGGGLALLCRRLTHWGIERFGIDALAERLGVARLLYSVGIRASFPKVISQLVFLTLVLLTCYSAASLSGLPGVTEALAALMGYLPRLAGALGVFVAGMLGADFLARIARRIAEQREDIDSPELLGRFVYYSVVVLTSTLAAEHLGFEVALVNTLIQIVVAAACFGVAMAFAIGARETFRNLVARFYVGRLFRAGDLVRIGDLAGTIVAFSPTYVLIQEGKEEIIIPCHRFMNEATRLSRVNEAPQEQGDGEQTHS